MIIVLVGYMGSGKSTIGIELAKVLDYDFVDLDAVIAENENLSIPEIFSQKGEIYFRKKETHYLKDIISSKIKIVLSLGGGTPCYGNNMDLIMNNNSVESFYLKTSIPELLNRLWIEKQNRPLISHINSKENLTEYIGKHLFERSLFYSRSHHSIVTDGKMISEIVEQILLKLI
ncbi:shikimate kinase [Winogradskyella haliclonae]|uniref:Shikimate kinase n=1 Tax=Winogradskyella haliclonae TaxID=2048558 RepID=A0ABQ2BZP1_9FLAO|nr:shikimate kinase [Winogradskyella haliclonae]GGI57268.1 shikimate kinase [Winogradskyella haliclonae]